MKQQERLVRHVRVKQDYWDRLCAAADARGQTMGKVLEDCIKLGTEPVEKEPE
jgi:hypothetical protein